jgi:hypothetical protein
MPVADITDWIEDHSIPGTVWYAKRLSANDTLANKAHQAGPYVPKELLLEIIPELGETGKENPDHRFNLYIDSHLDHRFVRAVWYNKALFKRGTRNESRLTGFGGGESALLDPDSTGALAIFVFGRQPDGAVECHVWVCGQDGTEADLFESFLGPVEPKRPIVWRPGEQAQPSLFDDRPTAALRRCRLAPHELPEGWRQTFPLAKDIVSLSIERRSRTGMNPDVRLLARRECEYELFRSVEDAHYTPIITQGFASLDQFFGVAQTILQRRKSRSGKSLELQAQAVFVEEGLRPGVDFTHQPSIEDGKRPDFIFPSQARYVDPAFPQHRLRMLAAKTTCKDRWRQILSEADRVPEKHLLTLQEGVSEGQYREMRQAGVTLVVPEKLHRSYPTAIRPELVTVEGFIASVRGLER